LINAKKSLGQNFLTDRNILEKIVSVTEIRNKNILEIGPGTGNLTSFIIKNEPKKIIVIEKDNELAMNLSSNFGEQLTVINDDILDINEQLLFKEKVTVFGNLPYNISTEILSKWIINLKDIFWFDHLVLMFQKEVADRIIANVNSSAYGRLSILANWKLYIKKICDIKPECFSPRPKIDSSLLFFTPKKNFLKLEIQKT
jgi:16S rRNA (adenine1518-N6/adenine1519-N6)-dimethyltransferase